MTLHERSWTLSVIFVIFTIFWFTIMFHVTIQNAGKIFRSDVGTNHTAETSAILRDGRRIRVSNDYILRRNFWLHFFSFLEKYRELKPIYPIMGKNSNDGLAYRYGNFSGRVDWFAHWPRVAPCVFAYILNRDAHKQHSKLNIESYL